MNISEFKADEGLVKGWKSELQQNQILKHAMEAVITDSPLNKDFAAASETEALIHFGELQGYEKCIRNLFDLGNLSKLPEQLRPTYGVKSDASRS